MEKIDSKENLIRLVNQYKNLVFSICLKLTGDYFVAEDITQDTFIAAYTHFQDFDGSSEKAWICRIASNKCIDYKRMAARRNVPFPEEDMPIQESDSFDDPLQMILNVEIMSGFCASCNNLPPPYCDVANMHFVQGLTAREIAEKKGIHIKTVQTQIYRAREMLKKSIRKEELLS